MVEVIVKEKLSHVRLVLGGHLTCLGYKKWGYKTFKLFEVDCQIEVEVNIS